MSVYKSERPEYLEKALYSIWEEQTVKPYQIILIQDGPVGEELTRVIEAWKLKLNNKLILIKNKNNLGLTKSLNKGICYINSDFIARMDSDDISFPDRFEKQLDYMINHPDVMVVGGGIQEIDEEGDPHNLRLYPSEINKIRKYITKANPLAHSTTFIRRRVFDDGFRYNEKFRKNQDLDLWFRLLAKGYVISNLAFPVLYFRRTKDTYSKRSTLISLKSELSIYLHGIYSLYGICTWRYIYPISRFLIKIMPPSFVDFYYRHFFKKNNL